MRFRLDISKGLSVPLEADNADEAVRQLPDVLNRVLFDNDLIQENARKFGTAADAYFSSENKAKLHSQYAEFTHCPEILVELWGSNYPVYMPHAVLDKLERMPTSKKQGHHIAIDIIKKIPIAIHDPIMVFHSATDIKGTSLIALLELQSPDPEIGKKQNLCSVVEFDVKGRMGIVDIVKSVYGRPDHQYKSWVIRDRSAIYVDIKRAGKWLPVTGLQLPGVKSFSGSGHTILTKEEFVKRRIAKILPEIAKQESEQLEMNL